MTKRALVLSGGGSHGAFQVGVLKKLMGEQKTSYDIFCGISVGAINASFLSQKSDPQASFEALLGQWEKVNDASIKKSWFWGYLACLWKQSVYDSSPLWSWIRSSLDENLIKSSGKQLRMVTTSWDTGESFVADETMTGLADWVIASCSYPLAFCPISINGQLWTDGGLRSVTPLGEAIKAGADEIDVIMCSNPFGPDPFVSKGKHAIPDFGMRALDIMGDEIERADLKACGLKNEIAVMNPKYKLVKIRVFEPSAALPVSSLSFAPEGVQQMIDLGYAASANPTSL